MKGFLQEHLFLRRCLVAHLGLQVLDLLLKEVILLLLVDVLARLVAYVCFQVLQVNLAVQSLHGTKKAFLHALDLQQAHFLLDAEGHIGADKVEGHLVITDIGNSKGSFIGNFFSQVDVFVGHLAQIVNGSIPLAVALVGL